MTCRSTSPEFDLADLHWYRKQLTLPFRLGDWVIWRKRLDMRVYDYGLAWILSHATGFTFCDITSMIRNTGSDRLLFRSLPIQGQPPRLTRASSHFLYVAEDYQRYFVDLTLGPKGYAENFSSKSRSTLRRKVRKFSTACGGNINWREYRTPSELEEFYPAARNVSKKSYQENLLDGGLPDDDGFRDQMLLDGAHDSVRAYLLFDDNGDALAYLYCPVHERTVLYQYLGYVADHPFNSLSPGTVLLWLVLQRLQEEACYSWFDFTEGSDRNAIGQKARFSTGSVYCADIWIFPRTISYTFLLTLHRIVDNISESAGALLERLGLKHHIRRWIRGRSA